MSFQKSKRYFLQSISYQFSGFEFLAQMVPLKVLQRHRNGLKRDVSLHFLNFINHDFWISYPQKHTWVHL